MADASGEKATIVVKRIKKVAGGHHGGAWKIAYADFVTAMMAFFLLMWLLGSTTRGDLQGIADYFKTPLRVALQGGSGSGDSSHVLKGGGKDLTRSEGQVNEGQREGPHTIIDIKAAEAERTAREKQALQALQAHIEEMIAANPQVAAFRNQLLLDLTTEGLRIQIVDDQSRPMFDSGGTEMRPYAREILRQLAPVLNGVENHVALSGHTDGTPYAGGSKGYSNWELSAERANASRRELIAGGLDDSKILRVVGLGSAVMLNKDNPNDPVNRRISIVVLNKATEDSILADGAKLETSTDAPVTPEQVQQNLPAKPPER